MTRIAITGSSGLVGTALQRAFTEERREVVCLVRNGPGPGRWDPATGRLDSTAMAGVGCVVHLAGVNIARRWSSAHKRAVRDSRVLGTQALCRALAGLARPPQVLLCASAVGWYGDRGDERVDESSAPGQGFLAEVARDWEAATAPAAAAGIRVVHLRIGMVLAAAGGALGRMLLPFRLGFGGPLGNGRQFISWITRGDLVAAIRFLRDRHELAGAFNCVAPNAVRQHEFAAALGRALHRPALLPTPAFAVRLLFGEMGSELLLAGQNVAPTRLQQAGFRWQHEDIDSAMRAALTDR